MIASCSLNSLRVPIGISHFHSDSPPNQTLTYTQRNRHQPASHKCPPSIAPTTTAAAHAHTQRKRQQQQRMNGDSPRRDNRIEQTTATVSVLSSPSIQSAETRARAHTRPQARAPRHEPRARLRCAMLDQSASGCAVAPIFGPQFGLAAAPPPAAARSWEHGALESPGLLCSEQRALGRRPECPTALIRSLRQRKRE